MFRAGALPRNIERLGGILDNAYSNQITCNPEVARCGGACGLCKDICMHLPFDAVMRVEPRRPRNGGNVCIRDKDRFSIVAGRTGGREYLRSGKPLVCLLSRSVSISSGPAPSDPQKSLYVLEDNVLEQIEFLRDEYGCDPGQVDRRTVCHHLTRQNTPLPYLTGKRSLSRDTLNSLILLGFNAVAEDYRLL